VVFKKFHVVSFMVPYDLWFSYECHRGVLVSQVKGRQILSLNSWWKDSEELNGFFFNLKQLDLNP